MEVWNAIPGHEGYEASNFGRIRSYKTNSGKLSNKPKILKEIITDKNYRRIAIRKEKRKQRIWFLHRLIMLSFVGKPKKGQQVNHINGIKSDNRLENLEYCTPSQNNFHAYKSGIRKKLYGEKSPASKLTRKQALKIKYRENGLQKDIAKKYNISKEQVCNIKNNKSWVGL